MTKILHDYNRHIVPWIYVHTLITYLVLQKTS